MLILERIDIDKAYIYDDDTLITADISEIHGCAVGDVLIKSNDEYITDKEQTSIRKKRLCELKRSLME